MKTSAQQATDDQTQQPLFKCNECGEVIVAFQGRFFHTCEHVTAAIVATPEAAKAVASDNR